MACLQVNFESEIMLALSFPIILFMTYQNYSVEFCRKQNCIACKVIIGKATIYRACSVLNAYKNDADIHWHEPVDEKPEKSDLLVTMHELLLIQLLQQFVLLLYFKLQPLSWSSWIPGREVICKNICLFVEGILKLCKSITCGV